MESAADGRANISQEGADRRIRCRRLAVRCGKRKQVDGLPRTASRDIGEDALLCERVQHVAVPVSSRLADGTPRS